MLEGNAVEDVISFLKERGCSKIQTIKILVVMESLALSEAKRLVHLSEAWKMESYQDEEFHDLLEKTLKEKE